MADNLESSYTLGRRIGSLSDTTKGSDLAFGSERIDKKKLQNLDFKHCTFSNISFKESTLENGKFLNCVFVACYFRRSTLVHLDFFGCRFIDCNFSRVTIHRSRFDYSVFRQCQIPFVALEHNLPSEANLREELARNLFMESRALGLHSEARDYRLAALEAQEAHLIAAISGRSEWYRSHFHFSARVKAGIRLAISLFNRYFWLYGERARTLLRTAVVIAFGVFPFTFYISRSGLSKTSGGDVALFDFVYFSIESFLPSHFESGIEALTAATRLLATIESLLGLLVIALFASHVVRWSLHR